MRRRHQRPPAARRWPVGDEGLRAAGSCPASLESRNRGVQKSRQKQKQNRFLFSSGGPRFFFSVYHHELRARARACLRARAARQVRDCDLAELAAGRSAVQERLRDGGRLRLLYWWVAPHGRRREATGHDSDPTTGAA